MRRPRRGANWGRQRGSAMVEFPFVVLILMFLLILVADLGRLTTWAQQMAYATDAGAQFAYRRYLYSASDNKYQIDDPDADEITLVEPEKFKEEIEEHIKSAVGGLEFDLDDDDVDIEITEIDACPNLTLESDNTVTLTYTVDGTCANERRFIEVEVSNVFEPFTPIIKHIMIKEWRTHEFKVYRQIFDAP
ncbi:hypothetical protein CCR82_11440 [Halochromatium salexigens]|uniref:TadE-like domain-containing protein n=2 Tax=Halochromatium salexigens TaxID=49447 RepID=A0AAJ0UGM4_HALSE|nr:hypothetical protein [Halochromatium salexigens]